MTNQKLKNLIKEYIKNHIQMVLATADNNHPWIATVYYGVDEDLNMYFLSDPNTIHCKQISLNPKVSVSIADSPQDPKNKKVGIQIYGTSVKLNQENEIRTALVLWKKALKVTNEDYSYEAITLNKIEGKLYKITPKIIKYFNQNLWEEGREPILEL